MPLRRRVTRTLELDHDHVIDRLYLIERNVNEKFSELARTWAVLGQRLEVLEQMVAERAEGGDQSGALARAAGKACST